VCIGFASAAALGLPVHALGAAPHSAGTWALEGKEAKVVKRKFLATHHGAYRIMGYRFAFVGAVYKPARGGYAAAYYLSGPRSDYHAGFQIYKGTHGGHWHAVARAPRYQQVDLQPSPIRHTTVSGELRVSHVDRQTQTITDSDAGTTTTYVTTDQTTSDFRFSDVFAGEEPFRSSGTGAITNTHTDTGNPSSNSSCSGALRFTSPGEPVGELTRRAKNGKVTYAFNVGEIEDVKSCGPAPDFAPAATFAQPAGTDLTPWSAPVTATRTKHSGSGTAAEGSTSDAALTIKATARSRIVGLALPFSFPLDLEQDQVVHGIAKPYT
jgi:hypothetical protein